MKEQFNAKELLIEQLQKTIKDVSFSPMVKYAQPYKDFQSRSKSGFVDLESVSPEKLKFWSDPHFSHQNIIKYCNRPFSTTGEMDAKLIHAYNEGVEDDDVVVCVGDVAFGSYTRVNEEILPQLKGYKILIMGNHDFHHHTKFPINYDFDETHVVLTVKNFVISHHPWWDIPNGWYNIHGHLHNKKTSNPKHINVGVELLDYKPISLAEIMESVGL